MFKLLEPSHVIWFVFGELKKIILIKHSFFAVFILEGLTLFSGPASTFLICFSENDGWLSDEDLTKTLDQGNVPAFLNWLCYLPPVGLASVITLLIAKK